MMSPVTEGCTTIYASSCNPSRKAKLSRPPETSSQPGAPTSIITAASIAEDASNSQPQSQPAKRGRKPGTMSKAARETQRKLNHSIIEKARRTKINDALATLRQLVPPDFGHEKKQADRSDEDVGDDDDDEDGDGDYPEKRKPKTKNTGKKEEKEREFKLEILIRTVAYMQHLVQRVKDLEEEGRVQASSYPSKRKRDTVVDDSADPDRETNRRQKLDNPIDQSSQHSSQYPSQHPPRPRLPSISAWLPEPDPAPKAHSQSPAIRPGLVSPSLPFLLSSPAHLPSHLPSPPSSTYFTSTNPTHKGAQQLPSLSLGPTAVITHSRGYTLTATSAAPVNDSTPEEESAASLLLNFRRGSSCSPAFLPTPGSSVAFGNGGTLTRLSPKFTTDISPGEPEPVALALGPSRSKEWSSSSGFRFSLPSSSSEFPVHGVGDRNLVAQTPSSILGLTERSKI